MLPPFVVLFVLHFAVEAVEGYFLIFAPFLPALGYVLVVRSRWLAKAKAKTE